MKKLERSDLLSLEQYHNERPEFRAKVLAHKHNRQVAVGPHARLCFEDRLTMQYQVQEMLRIERIYEREAVEEELAAYNPLIPDGGNLKATFMMEYTDVAERQRELQRLACIEDKVYAQVDGFEPVTAISDEDLERTSKEKTSAVHFLRFELSEEMCAALKAGADIGFGIDHEHYSHKIEAVPRSTRDSLAADLE